MGRDSQNQTGEPTRGRWPSAATEPAEHYLLLRAVASSRRRSHHRAPRRVLVLASYKADFWPDRNLSWKQTHPITLETRDRQFMQTSDTDWSLWRFRKILDVNNFVAGSFPAIFLL
jgi:hypothetical protein